MKTDAIKGCLTALETSTISGVVGRYSKECTEAVMQLEALETALAYKVQVALDDLREIEWTYDLECRMCYCQVCNEFEKDGHDKDCWLGNALNEKL